MEGKLEPVVMTPHKRLASAVAGAHRRLARGGKGASGEPVWTPAMTGLFVAGIGLALIVSFADAAAIHYARQSPDPVIRLMAWITDIGKSQWYLVPAAMVFVAIGLRDWTSLEARGKTRLAFLFGQAAYVFSAVALSGTFVNIIKILFGRARPKLIDEVGAWSFDPLTLGYLNASFPSGHSTTMGALTGILMIWYPRWWVVIVELGLFAASTRIAAGAHYPSDVVAGFLIGLFFSIVLARWLASRGVVFRFVAGKILPVPMRLPQHKTLSQS